MLIIPAHVVCCCCATPLLQVQQGRLSAAGPVAWLAFKTDSSDMRTCGVNVQPSRSGTVVTSWTAVGRYALNSATLTCDAGSSTMSTIASAGFTAALPAVVSLGYGLPASCTPVFSKPAPDISAADNTACKSWLLGHTPTFPTSPVCPCELVWVWLRNHVCIRHGDVCAVAPSLCERHMWRDAGGGSQRSCAVSSRHYYRQDQCHLTVPAGCL